MKKKSYIYESEIVNLGYDIHRGFIIDRDDEGNLREWVIGSGNKEGEVVSVEQAVDSLRKESARLSKKMEKEMRKYLQKLDCIEDTIDRLNRGVV